MFVLRVVSDDLHQHCNYYNFFISYTSLFFYPGIILHSYPGSSTSCWLFQVLKETRVLEAMLAPKREKLHTADDYVNIELLNLLHFVSWYSDFLQQLQIQMYIPTDPFTIFEPQNPSIDVSERHKARRSTDFEALKL